MRLEAEQRDVLWILNSFETFQGLSGCLGLASDEEQTDQCVPELADLSRIASQSLNKDRSHFSVI